jgi:hypothetical protein
LDFLGAASNGVMLKSGFMRFKFRKGFATISSPARPHDFDVCFADRTWEGGRTIRHSVQTVRTTVANRLTVHTDFPTDTVALRSHGERSLARPQKRNKDGHPVDKPVTVVAASSDELKAQSGELYAAVTTRPPR